MVCKRNKHSLNKQIMGDLPAEKLSGAAPFVYTALDLFGPWKVRELANGRRLFKVWGVMFSCLSTKAVCILASPGYDTATFATVYRRFCALYNSPTKVFCDHGPQLLAHAGAEELSLGEVAEEAGRQGTTWVFSPKGCSWRNGQAEVCIKLARHTLSHQLASADPLDFHSLETTFLQVAAILNRRPIAVRYSSSTDYHSISPADILFGRAHWQRPELADLPQLPQDLAARRALDHQQQVVAAWHEQWLAQALPEMIPRTTWKKEFRSVEVGDIGHIVYKSSLGQSAFRLCRVSSTSPDAHGVVRTLTVSFRPRHRAEQGPRYTAKDPVEMVIGVQRFSCLLPIELQQDEAFSLSPSRRPSPLLTSPPSSLTSQEVTSEPCIPTLGPSEPGPVQLAASSTSTTPPAHPLRPTPTTSAPPRPATPSELVTAPPAPTEPSASPLAPSELGTEHLDTSSTSPLAAPVRPTPSIPQVSTGGGVRRQPSRKCKLKAGIFFCVCK